jgi:predicted Zn-dependent peptidase
LLWPNHPLGLPTIGTLDCIAAVTRADLENHLHSYYIPDSAVVVVAGPVQHQEIFADSEAVFGNWKGGAAQEVQAVTKRYLSPKVSFVRDSDSQMAMQLGFLGFARNDPRFMSLRLLRRLLAGGGSSRLHLRLREELGIVYSVE